MENSNKQELVLVPEKWLKSLLEDANDFEKAFKDYQFGNVNNDKIINKAVMLMGYAKSASSIIESNPRVKK